MIKSKPDFLDFFQPLSHSYLSVVVPVFNEALNILENLNLLLIEIEPFFSNFEIIVIDDGSTDGTSTVLKDFSHPQVKIVKFEQNKGKGFAIREGFKQAHGDYLLFIDGGMELHPKQIRIFFVLMALYQADIILGSKRHPQSQVDYPSIRKFLSFIYQLMIRYLFNLNVTDTQVGIKLFRKEVIQAIQSELTIDRYGFDLEFLVLASKKGFSNLLEAPIQLDYFTFNRLSNIKEFLHVVKVGSTLMKDTWNLYRRTKKIYAPK